MKLPSLKLGSLAMTRLFMAAATMLSLGSAALSFQGFFDGNPGQGVLLAAVSIFSAWMATAIQQFHERISGIDEVVRQAKRRVEQSDVALAEMRQLAQRLRTSSPPEDKEEDRTIH